MGVETAETIKRESLSRTILKELSVIVGSEYLLFKDDIPAQYGYDSGTKNYPPHLPEAIVFPGNVQEIASIVKLANLRNFIIIPRGGGTGLCGGAVSLKAGIILDLKRMNHILEINSLGNYAVVEPGVKTCVLQSEAEKVNLLYTGDPCSNNDCVIGGNIATNAGGNKAVKYGVTSDQIYELEIVTPLGEITTLGARLKKNSTGYNLVRLLSGSEGTLGIVTKAVLKLHPLAPYYKDYLISVPDLLIGINIVQQIIGDRLIDPITLELMDSNTVQAIEKFKKQFVFGNPQTDLIMLQLEAYSDEEVNLKETRLKQILSEFEKVTVAYPKDSELAWEGRRTWGDAIKDVNKTSISEDLVLPVDKLSNFIQAMLHLLENYSLDFRLAGHVGDGNLHIDTIPGKTTLENWPRVSKEYTESLHEVVYALGGRLSGEHGIGFKRKEILKDLIDPVELQLMQNIKKALDPNNILNPGKIFDLY